MLRPNADEANGEFLQLLRAEREIGRLITRFARCIDTKDFAGYAACYALDGVLTTPWGSHLGREGLAEYVERDLGHFVATQHVSAGHEIEVDGDHATARSTLLATHVTQKDGEEFWTVGGHYDLALVRQDGAWLFLSVAIYPSWRFEASAGSSGPTSVE